MKALLPTLLMTFLYLFVSDLWNPIYSLLVRLLPFTAFLLNLLALLPSLSRLCWKGLGITRLVSATATISVLLRDLCTWSHFFGLQVGMWDKGGHFLVTDQTTEGDPDKTILCAPDSLSTLAGTFLCFPFLLWRNYCGLKGVSNMNAAKFYGTAWMGHERMMHVGRIRRQWCKAPNG